MGLYAVADEIGDRTAALIEPFTMGTRAARRSQPQASENAIVFGAGTIGIAAAIALKEFGCREVLVCDLSDFRLEKVRTLGFPTCNTGREDLGETASTLFGTAHGLDGTVPDADIYLDAAGAPAVLEQFLTSGKIGSRMVMVDLLAGQRPVDILRMTYAQQSLIGAGGYFPEDVQDVLKIMGRQKYNISSIITQEFYQNEIVEAFETASDANHALNVVIRYACSSGGTSGRKEKGTDVTKHEIVWWKAQSLRRIESSNATNSLKLTDRTEGVFEPKEKADQIHHHSTASDRCH